MHVFVDESERHGTYLLCAAIYDPADLAKARAILRGFAKPGQRRVHMVKEQDSRRREILGVIATSRVRGRIYLCDGPAVPAREACLWQLVGDPTIARRSTQSLILESMDGQDRQTIAKARKAMPALKPTSYEQLRAHEEPLLAVADCMAWAYGAGGDWRRRIDPLIEKSRNCASERTRKTRNPTSHRPEKGRDHFQRLNSNRPHHGPPSPTPSQPAWRGGRGHDVIWRRRDLAAGLPSHYRSVTR